MPRKSRKTVIEDNEYAIANPSMRTAACIGDKCVAVKECSNVCRVRALTDGTYNARERE